LLQARRGLDEPAAYRWLQRASMDGRTTMRAVSELVVAQEANQQREESTQPPT
jgi:AmiR/NasT family two-component response regulator